MWRHYYKILLLGLFFSVKALASVVDIQSVRLWAAPDSTRVVFDLSHSATYALFTLENPDRVVIDIQNAQFKAPIDEISLMDSRIKHIRHSNTAKGLRIVLDLEEKLSPSAFLLSPHSGYGNRLVVDLGVADKTSATQKISPRPPEKKNTQAKKPARDFIVAIDPGHGGDDSGAVGRHKQLQEKAVVLEVSKKLATLVNAQPHMRAYLVRNGDYYVGLRKRMTLARAEGADLFISVHADSVDDPRASGASVFVLSEKGASSEAARWLAESENKADLAGGVKLEDKGHVLASVLLDLSQTASQKASYDLAHLLVNSLMKVTDLHHRSVQKAGFMVLKSPDIPSVLVELGFISNKQGEEKLHAKIHATNQNARDRDGFQRHVSNDVRDNRRNTTRRGDAVWRID